MDYAVHVPHHKVVPNPTQFRQDDALLALGKAIREARGDAGLSQEALALLAGVDRGYLGRVERGDNNVALLTLLKLARALGLTGAELMAKAAL